MSRAGRSTPPREPCSTAPAAMTPRGTALRRPSTTSAISSLYAVKLSLASLSYQTWASRYFSFGASSAPAHARTRFSAAAPSHARSRSARGRSWKEVTDIGSSSLSVPVPLRYPPPTRLTLLCPARAGSVAVFGPAQLRQRHHHPDDEVEREQGRGGDEAGAPADDHVHDQQDDRGAGQGQRGQPGLGHPVGGVDKDVLLVLAEEQPVRAHRGDEECRGQRGEDHRGDVGRAL